MSAASKLGRAALAYAARLGWPVFPLRGKEPRTARGVLDATTDATTIATWWTRWPDANIGLACSGRVVLDVDPRNGGDVVLEQLEEELGALPATAEVKTGSNGRHLYYLPRYQGAKYRKTAGDGLDVQAGPGKYVVAPPSVHPVTGRPYSWVSSPLEVPLATLPATWWARVERVDAADMPPPIGDVEGCGLVRMFARAGLYSHRIDAARAAVRCPWERAHDGGKGGRGGATSTVLFAATDRAPIGTFHCSHSSHGDKRLEDVLAVLPREIVAVVLEEERVEAEYLAAERAAIQWEAAGCPDTEAA